MLAKLCSNEVIFHVPEFDSLLKLLVSHIYKARFQNMNIIKYLGLSR